MKFEARPMRVTQPASYELPALFNREIGRIVVRWAYLEHYLQNLCFMLLRLSQVEGRLAVRSPRASDRLDMIDDLVFLNKLSTDNVAAERVRRIVSENAEFRDLFAHGLWTFSRTHNKWSVQNTRGSWRNSATKDRTARKKLVAPEGVLVTLRALKRTVTDLEQAILDAKLIQATLEKQLQERA